MDGFKKCTSRPAPSVCRFLQQNLPTRDSCTAAKGSWGRLIRLEPGWGLPNYRGVPIPAARHPVWTCTWLCAASAHPRLGPFLWATRRFKNSPLLGERSSDQQIVLTPHWDIPVLEGGPDRHIAPVPRRVSELERPQPVPGWGRFCWHSRRGIRTRFIRRPFYASR